MIVLGLFITAGVALFLLFVTQMKPVDVAKSLQRNLIKMEQLTDVLDPTLRIHLINHKQKAYFEITQEEVTKMDYHTNVVPHTSLYQSTYYDAEEHILYFYIEPINHSQLSSFLLYYLKLIILQNIENTFEITLTDIQYVYPMTYHRHYHYLEMIENISAYLDKDHDVFLDASRYHYDAWKNGNESIYQAHYINYIVEGYAKYIAIKTLVKDHNISLIPKELKLDLSMTKNYYHKMVPIELEGEFLSTYLYYLLDKTEDISNFRLDVPLFEIFEVSFDPQTYPPLVDELSIKQFFDKQYNTHKTMIGTLLCMAQEHEACGAVRRDDYLKVYVDISPEDIKVIHQFVSVEPAYFGAPVQALIFDAHVEVNAVTQLRLSHVYGLLHENKKTITLFVHKDAIAEIDYTEHQKLTVNSVDLPYEMVINRLNFYEELDGIRIGRDDYE